MSKTLGNVIDPEELLAEYGTDAVRYFLARHINPFDDGDITRESFKEMYNANLANGLGNLASRIRKLAQDNLIQTVGEQSMEFPPNYTTAFQDLNVHGAIDEIFRHIQGLDQRITLEEPFKLIKADPEKGKRILTEMTQELYYIAYLLEPFMPETSEKIKSAVVANKKPENLFPRKD